MNLLKTFEGRISDAFGAAPGGSTAPFSFKKLAKRAAREMEAETFVIDGVDTAPALFTILVSAADDAAMRPLYPQITAEITSFVEAQAQNKGYVFVGKPLTRFMVDPSLRSGKFAVFAENVDRHTLGRLREEEDAFLSGSAGLGGAASASGPISVDIDEPDFAGSKAAPARQQASHHAPVQVPSPEQPAASAAVQAPLPVEPSAQHHGAARQEQPKPEPSPAPAPEPEPKAEPAPAPAAAPAQDQQPAAAEENPVIASIYEPAHEEFAPIENPADASSGLNVIPNSTYDDVVRARAEEPQHFQPITPVPEESASIAPAPIGVPQTQRRNVPLVNPYRQQAEQRRQQGADRHPATCMLIDHQSGRTYTGQAPSTVIGRERTPGGIVLHDPNVSRQHAELTYDGRSWRISDLGSTNGTLVNDIDIESTVLHDGDLITLGLMNLEFREMRA